MREQEAKMGMMYEMMQNMMKSNMAEMCSKMMERMSKLMHGPGWAAISATPEMRGLFEEWLKNLEMEVLEFLKEKGRATPEDVASKLKLSRESVILLLAKLAREGKITIGEVKVA